MRFVCFGYADLSQFATMDPQRLKVLMDECFAYDDELRRGGHFVGGEALQDTTKAVTVRMNGGVPQAMDGPYAETKEQIGGILFLEADNMQHAIELMLKHPGVKMGPFEIRPADDFTNQLIRERDQSVSPRN